MDKLLAITAACLAVALAGCATPAQTKTAASGGGKDVEVYTGSRIPSKSTSSHVQSVTGEAWRRESAPVIANQPPGN